VQVISLFSGIGGFEISAEWMGWDNVVSCEINDFGHKVLSYYWPNAYHHRNVKDLTRETILKNSRWNPLRTTIVVGGFP
jgi:DNA (cytosine-5)-methyltransferase 1